MVTTTIRHPLAHLLIAAAIISATTGLTATLAPGTAQARPDSHSSDSDSGSNGSRPPGRHVDPFGFHNPPVDQRDRARIDANRRDYYNQQRARQNGQAGDRPNDGEHSPTWTRVVRPDGSWYVCRPTAARC